MEIEEIAPRLWWWTAPHPDWGPPDFEGGQGWEREVSCYALVADETLVLFDPLVPLDDEERFWQALDGDVEHHGPPAILLTIYWHARSAQEILDRYDGATLWAHEPATAPVGERVRITHTFRDGNLLPGEVEAVGMHHRDEAAFWLARHGRSCSATRCSATTAAPRCARRAGSARARRSRSWSRRCGARSSATRSGCCSRTAARGRARS